MLPYFSAAKAKEAHRRLRRAEIAGRRSLVGQACESTTATTLATSSSHAGAKDSRAPPRSIDE